MATAVRQDWRDLTWAEVEDWAGLRSVERGREYCRAGRVSRLATDGGDLIAWVRGGGRYVCRVRRDGGLRGRCTCPFDGPGCKHAVAAVLAYLDALRRGTDVPEADETDPVWQVPEVDDRTAATPPDDPDALRREIADALIAPVASACESVMPPLRKLRSLLLASGRRAEWDAYEAGLRQAHPRRARLHEVLARLATRRIVPAQGR